jgi:hypothetical protein
MSSRLGLPSATCWDRDFADSPLEEAGFELLVPLPSRTCAEPYRPALMLRKPEDETRKPGRALSILRAEVRILHPAPPNFEHVRSMT